MSSPLDLGQPPRDGGEEPWLRRRRYRSLWPCDLSLGLVDLVSGRDLPLQDSKPEGYGGRRAVQGSMSVVLQQKSRKILRRVVVVGFATSCGSLNRQLRW